MPIYLASGNAHKKDELAAIFRGPRLLLPKDAGIEDFDPDETGAAFTENALIKARALYAALSAKGIAVSGAAAAGPGAAFSPVTGPDFAVLADDSGLCVDALGGRPGVFSARYGSRADAGTKGGGKPGAAPEKQSASTRNALLLEEVNAALSRRTPEQEDHQRSCRFVCAMVLLFSPDRFYLVQETLEGELVENSAAARGHGGFGYDPIVYLPEFGRTVAELSETEKNALSHRGKAGRTLMKLLAAET